MLPHNDGFPVVTVVFIQTEAHRVATEKAEEAYRIATQKAEKLADELRLEIVQLKEHRQRDLGSRAASAEAECRANHTTKQR
jgi:hypothetical protein